MAVVDVTQMWSRDGGTISTDREDLTFRGIVRTTAFQVLTDDPNTNQIDVENAADLPGLGTLYPGSTLARAVKITPQRMGPVFWQVAVEYAGDNEFELNRPIIKKSSVTTSEPIDVDWFGRAIVNTNHEIVEGLSRDISDTLITITRNFTSVNDDLALAYLESTNSDFFGDGINVGPYAPGRVRLLNYQAEQKFKNSVANTGYWEVTAQFQARYGYLTTPDKAWHKRYRNEGLLVKDDDGFLIKPVDENGNAKTKPVLLKQDGRIEENPNNAVFLFSQVYGQRPFNALGML